MTRNILFIVFLILLSAFFSGSEISYAGASEVNCARRRRTLRRKEARKNTQMI